MKKGSVIRGNWLKLSLDALGVTVYGAAKALGLKPDKFYRHIADQHHVSSESLAELALAFPRINLHYVLTGEGRKLLTPKQALLQTYRLSIRFKPDLLQSARQRATALNLNVPAYVRGLIEQDIAGASTSTP